MSAPEVTALTIRLEITDVYPALGEEYVRDVDAIITEPMPNESTDPDAFDDWVGNHILSLTGQGGSDYENTHAGYFAEVLECEQEPSLVGREFSSEG